VKVEARQGVIGHNVRYVLWFGIAAAMVALAAVYKELRKAEIERALRLLRHGTAGLP
jgi:hypothetical protein